MEPPQILYTDGGVYAYGDVLFPQDETAFVGLTRSGIVNEQVWDSRDGYALRDMHGFAVKFADGTSFDIKINVEFSADRALDLALYYGEELGRIPTVLRDGLNDLFVHDVEGAWGNVGIMFLGAQTGVGAPGSPYLHEVAVHELGHAIADPHLNGTPAWKEAQASDNAFVSTYAFDYPDREDVAETFNHFFIATSVPDRVPPEQLDALREAVGHRLALLEGLALDLSLIDRDLLDLSAAGFGTAADDHLVLDPAGDAVKSGDGQDTLRGGPGADRIVLGQGDDVAQSGAGDDTITAGQGNDSITAGPGDDLIYGGGNHDTILSGAGNDTVYGGDGRDEVTLSNGHDVFYDNAQGGVKGRDVVSGGGGDDTIIGGDGNDRFSGGAGQDSISAAKGNDTVFGGTGRDQVRLGAGDDIFVDTDQGGVPGRDTITGGDGADTFRFRANSGADVITDFEIGFDTLELDADLVGGQSPRQIAASAHITDIGIVLDFGAGNRITLRGVESHDGLAKDIEII